MTFSKFLKGIPIFLVLFEACCFGQTSNQELLNQINESRKFQEQGAQSNLSILQSEEIGTLEIVQKYSPPSTFSLASRHTFFYTDNVFLKRDNEVNTLAWLGNVGVSYVPYSTFRWTPRVTIEADLMRFDRVSAADFDSQTLTMASHFDLTDNKSISWDAAISLRRFDGTRANVGEFYKQVEYESSFNWIHPLAKQKRIFFLGSFETVCRQASPDAEDRVEAGIAARIFYQPTAKWEFESYVRPAYRYYPHDFSGQHNDLHLSAGLNASWKFIRHFSIGAGIQWLGNYSDVKLENYNAWLPSCGITVDYEF